MVATSLSTVGPETGTFWVEDPEVAEVLDLDTGEHMQHDRVIGTDYEAVIQLRSELRTAIQREQPRYACSMCAVPVYLVCHKDERRFFFRHTLEDGRCPARTRGALSQDEIDARRYNGVKESRAHIQMKEWVAESLRADPNFSDVLVEQRWSGALTKEWRKPDVRATYRGTPAVFEVQLSTTYINVITARREFYLREGGLLLWVFAKFELGARRLTQDDVFFNNNRNAFVASKATRDASVEQGAFKLECIWATPTLAGAAEAQRAIVDFDQLTLEPTTQRAYFFDFDGERRRLHQRARAEEIERRAPLREKFEDWCMRRLADRSNEDNKTWGELRRECSAEGVALPAYPNKLPWPLLTALYSAKHGRSIGWEFTTFIQVAHRVASGLPQHLRHFRQALAAYERAEQLRQEDKSGRWLAKVKEYTPLLKANDPKYAADPANESLVRLLFPELYPLAAE